MSIGAVKTDSNAVKAKEPSDVFVSDGTFKYPVGHPLYFTELMPDGTLLLDCRNNELSEFRVSTDRDINLVLYNHKEGARFRLFIYRATPDAITVSFDAIADTLEISGDASGTVSVLNIEVVKLNGFLKPLVVDDIDDAITSPTETWSSEKIQAEIDLLALGTSSHTSNTGNPHSVTKAQVGLGNADNTADTDKPISTAAQTALNNKADLVGGVVPSAQLPASLALGETESTAYRGDRGKEAYDLRHSHTNQALLNTITEQILKHESITVACSDELTDLEVATGVVEFQMPFAMTLTGVVATLTTAPVGSTLIVGINEGGSRIVSTPIQIDAGEKTSATAATPAVISDNSLAANSVITIDIDQVGATSTGTGLKVQLIGYRQ